MELKQKLTFQGIWDKAKEETQTHRLAVTKGGSNGAWVGGLGVSSLSACPLLCLLWPPPPAQATAFSRVRRREDWGWTGEAVTVRMKWKEKEGGVSSESNRQKERRESNKQASREQPCFVLLWSRAKIWEYARGASACARGRFRCERARTARRQVWRAGPTESYCKSGRESEEGESNSFESANRTVFWSGPYWHSMNNHERCLLSSKSEAEGVKLIREQEAMLIKRTVAMITYCIEKPRKFMQ